jgi:BirA family biotin operon repressor/biotin-[acetyl-CoA-carboxylase] ligase
MPPLETVALDLHGRFGQPYRYVAECASTQDLLRHEALPDGAVAVAEHQTAGRGRSDRVWEDVPGTALLCSILLRPAGTRTEALPQLSLVVALAACEAIEGETGRETRLKWPNDVLLDGRKVAGILLESCDGGVLAGVGVNVNQTAGQLPSDSRTPAASLRTATGREHDRGALLVTLLERLERAVGAWETDGLEALLPALEARNALHGRRVRVGASSGTAGRIAPDGRLHVTLEDGGGLLVGSGEVDLLGPDDRG